MKEVFLFIFFKEVFKLESFRAEFDEEWRIMEKCDRAHKGLS